jgi:hypothetical protein
VLERAPEVHPCRDRPISFSPPRPSPSEGRGAEKGIPYASNPALCPVRALAAWLEAAHIEDGPLFRGVDQLGNVAAEALSDRSVARDRSHHFSHHLGGELGGCEAKGGG